MPIEKVITTPPTAPQRADPATFPARADAMVTYLSTLVADVNTWAGETNDLADEMMTATATDASTATTKAAEARAYAENDEGVAVVEGEYSAKHYAIKADRLANEVEDVEVAPGKYSARHYAIKAAASALLAQIEAPPAWDAGTTYSYPQVAVGSDGNTYRCLGTDIVGENPVEGLGNWLSLTGASTGGGSPAYNFENCGGF